jgi:polysaccharide pyruvyl transferase CsaB
MRVLISAWAGSSNLGDELIHASLVGKLRRRGCTIASVSVDPAGSRSTHRVGAVGDRDPIGIWRAVGEADRLVFGGGGLVQDQTSLVNLPYHLARPAMASVRGTPWAGIGLGVGPLVSGTGRRLTRAVLSGARAVSVRDAASAEVLMACGVPRPIVSADLAFGLATPDVEAEDVLVCCLRRWTGGGRLPVALRRDRTPHWQVAAAARALDAASARTGLPVRLVALQPDRDGPLHHRVAEVMTAPVTCVAPGLPTVLGEIARSRVVVSVRYHGAVAAVLGGRPTVTLGYTPKVESLASDLAAGGQGLPFSPDGFAAIPGAVEAVLGQDDAAIAARERLRARERGNDRVLDVLLEDAERCSDEGSGSPVA